MEVSPPDVVLLLVYPPIYLLWRWHTEVKKAAEATIS